MSENISEKILETIKDQQLKPKPKWQFLLQDYMVWLSGLLAIMIGGLAFAVIIYMFVNNDWGLYPAVSNSLVYFIFKTLPYFWLIFLVLFIIIAYYNLKHTKQGYKLRLRNMVLITVLVSVLLGLFWYNIGFGQVIDNALSNKFPIYRQFINKTHQRALFLQNPDEGILIGVITEFEEIDMASSKNHVFTLVDWDNKEWQIISEPAVVEVLSVHLDKVDGPITIFGERLDCCNFKAYKIVPFIRGPNNMMFKSLKMPERNFPPMRIN